ncbi:glycoside hydrolase [Polyplosphaeria fusca]|uniref:Mannosyl-oligosaccharide glucosidase n=1 Tax=Polyplosphaeria fusca TaxID=682080 RepID=A0A9P4R0S7_9PLEO|nr:glycoside hydrolase [Polyplosphaeria fusca]
MHLAVSVVWAFVSLLVPALTVAQTLVKNNASLQWGPYRPNLYLGIRPRAPKSLLTGLMWGQLEAGPRGLRHTCEQNDGTTYGWTAYDARHGGTQTINDTTSMLDLTTEFVKLYEGQSAGNFGLRVRGIPRPDAPADLRTSIIFYVGMEALASCEECRLEATADQREHGDDKWIDSASIHVKHPELGVGTVHIPNPMDPQRNGRTEMSSTPTSFAIKSVNVTEDKIWQGKEAYMDMLLEGPGTPEMPPPNESGPANMHFVQFVFQGNFEFDVLYSFQQATRAITPAELTREFEDALSSITTRFSTVFAPKAPFDDDLYSTFGQSLLSNLLGGLGYFDGESLVDDSNAPEYEETSPQFWDKVSAAQQRTKPQLKGPSQLLSHVPSRSVFPRGFLWDEGFHLLPVLDWDADLALEVLHSWLSLMDEDGWIAREQILGAEARSRVPEDFQVQLPHIANPPTLFWIVSRYVKMLEGDIMYTGRNSVYLTEPDASKALLAELFPLLERHYLWFRKTQSGDVEAHSQPHVSLDEGYRWRGRKPGFNFASGLDDYPRPEPPDVSELHVDALAWVGLMAKTLSQVTNYLLSAQDYIAYETHYKNICHNIDALHWSAKEGRYCDTRIWEAVHDYSCTPGYISLLPFMLGFTGPSHPSLNATLNLIHDPAHLWTPYGVRSLSPTSSRYGTDDNYWRSPIWINMNYLLIEQLLVLATSPGPLQERCRQIYNELRKNVVDTVYTSWIDTGFAWEQYDDRSGKGKRTQGFTGWTALVVKIMAWPNLEEEQWRYGNFGSLLTEAKEHKKWGAGSIILVILLTGVIWVYRRRFARMFRNIGRHR